MSELTLPPRLLFPIHSAVHVIGVSRSGIYKLIKAGDLSVVKIGARTLIPHDELEAWVNRHRTGESESASSLRGPRAQP